MAQLAVVEAAASSLVEEVLVGGEVHARAGELGDGQERGLHGLLHNQLQPRGIRCSQESHDALRRHMSHLRQSWCSSLSVHTYATHAHAHART